MKEHNDKLKTLSILFGFLTVALFVFNFFVLLRLKPKMVIFESLTRFEEGLLTILGFGLLLILTFYLLSLWQFARYLRNSEQIKPLPLFLIISGVLSFLFIFSDIALLSDIHKQYRSGFSQPEWSLVLPIMVVQFIIAIIFLYIHTTNRLSVNREDHPERDINIFLIVQCVGVISGVMGFALASLGFLYTSGWDITIHGILGGIVLLFPYALVVFYWLVTKFQEKDRQWLDEKQSIDIGKSALATLLVNTTLMLILFIANIINLGGIINRIWFPIYLFTTILVFSIGNLYFSSKV